MIEPFMSVIICTWNRCNLLAEMLETLRCQRLSEYCNIEVLVVDNNSSDQTAALVQKLQTTWTLGRLSYVFEGKQGKQFALNHAVMSAAGNILVFTDDDVILPEDWLENILKVFSNEQVELAGGRTLVLWPGGQRPQWFRPSMLSVVAGVDHGDQRLFPAPADFFPAGTNLIARRAIFNRIGLFSESCYRHEDYEFGIRALKKGVRIGYNPNLIVYTRAPSAILNKRYFRHWYFNLGVMAATLSKQNTPVLLGIPRWVWRQLIMQVTVASAYRIRGQPDEGFEHEVLAIKLLGYITATLCQKFRPANFQRLVENCSRRIGARFE